MSTLIKIILINSLLVIQFACDNTQNKLNHLPYYNSANFEPTFITNPNEVKEKITHQIDSFKFINQNNEFVDSANLRTKVYVVNFMFTSCGNICPVMTDNLKLVVENFKNSEDVYFLSFTVTPWIDNVEQLKKYTLQKNISYKNWHFLTGDKKAIYDLARKSFFAEEEIGLSLNEDNFLHTEHILLIDQNGRIRGIYNGTLKLEMKQIVKDIQVLVKK